MSRKKAEKYILDSLNMFKNNDKNIELYKTLFKNMSDSDFKEFMSKLKSGDLVLNMLVPPEENGKQIDIESNFKILEKLNVDPFQYIVTEDLDGVKRVSYEKMLVLPAPFRRTKQTVEKGRSVSMGDNKVDVLTGQPIGDDRSSKISVVETRLLLAMGAEKTLNELLKDRGGDENAYRAFKGSIIKYGTVSDNFVANYRSSPTSSKTIKSYFAGMHFKISL